MKKLLLITALSLSGSFCLVAIQQKEEEINKIMRTRRIRKEARHIKQAARSILYQLKWILEGARILASECVDGRLCKKKVRSKMEENKKALEVVSLIGTKILKEKGIAEMGTSHEEKMHPDEPKLTEMLHSLKNLQGNSVYNSLWLRLYKRQQKMRDKYYPPREEIREGKVWKIYDDMRELNNLRNVEVVKNTACMDAEKLDILGRPVKELLSCEMATEILSKFKDYYSQGYFAEDKDEGEGKELPAEPAPAIEKGLKEVIEEEEALKS